MTESIHYRPPGWFTRNVMNHAVRWFTRRGLSVWGSRVLEVPGRRTGRPQQVPVNLLELDGRLYLVAARGETEWVRNVRANDGHLSLMLGNKRSTHLAAEIADADKIEILRAYLKRWKAEVGVFFDGVDASSTDSEILAIAPQHPVFELDTATGVDAA